MSDTLPTLLNAPSAARYAVSACDICVIADAMLASSVFERRALVSSRWALSLARASSSALRLAPTFDCASVVRSNARPSASSPCHSGGVAGLDGRDQVDSTLKASDGSLPFAMLLPSNVICNGRP